MMHFCNLLVLLKCFLYVEGLNLNCLRPSMDRNIQGVNYHQYQARICWIVVWLNSNRQSGCKTAVSASLVPSSKLLVYLPGLPSLCSSQSLHFRFCCCFFLCNLCMTQWLSSFCESQWQPRLQRVEAFWDTAVCVHSSSSITAHDWDSFYSVHKRICGIGQGWAALCLDSWRVSKIYVFISHITSWKLLQTLSMLNLWQSMVQSNWEEMFCNWHCWHICTKKSQSLNLLICSPMSMVIFYNWFFNNLSSTSCHMELLLARPGVHSTQITSTTQHHC
jgi:hypothetical protein